MGPCCASWGVPSRGSSFRNWVNVHGAQEYPFVMDANITIARTRGCKYRLDKYVVGPREFNTKSMCATKGDTGVHAAGCPSLLLCVRAPCSNLTSPASSLGSFR